MQSRPPLFALAIILAVVFPIPQGTAQSVTRTEALAIGESFVTHRWHATEANVHHGPDSSGIDVQTPDSSAALASPLEAAWTVGAENTGVPYKWGGFDNPKSFDAKIRSGRAAGDLYTSDKRRLGGAAVSGDAAGVDCSGFISRCWKLPRKHSTSMLIGICNPLADASELRPGDILNIGEGHVLLFVSWKDPEKTRARFYEAAPFSKTRASEQDIAPLIAPGYQPLRYRGIRD